MLHSSGRLAACWPGLHITSLQGWFETTSPPPPNTHTTISIYTVSPPTCNAVSAMATALVAKLGASCGAAGSAGSCINSMASLLMVLATTRCLHIGIQAQPHARKQATHKPHPPVFALPIWHCINSMASRLMVLATTSCLQIKHIRKHARKQGHK